MKWINPKNQEIKPKEGNTYWVTVLEFGNVFVEEATYEGKGIWKVAGKYGKSYVCDIEGWWPSPKPSPMKIRKKAPLLDFPDYEVGENGINVKIKVRLLDDSRMRKLGFTDFREGYWYLSKGITKDISFSISINKKDPLDFRIDVLDENFCQPYDYQSMLSESTFKEPPAVACTVYEKVEEIMDWLAKAGIVSGHVKGEYI